MKYYKVMCILGHQGRRNHNREIVFGIEARDIIEAQNKARKMPAVKHTKGVLCAVEIDFKAYRELRERNAYRVALGTRYNKDLT